MTRTKFTNCPCTTAERGCMYACPCHNSFMSGVCYPCIEKRHALDFAEWMWTVGIEYFRGGTYSVSTISGLDYENKTYTIEELYDHWVTLI